MQIERRCRSSSIRTRGSATVRPDAGRWCCAHRSSVVRRRRRSDAQVPGGTRLSGATAEVYGEADTTRALTCRASFGWPGSDAPDPGSASFAATDARRVPWLPPSSPSVTVFLEAGGVRGARRRSHGRLASRRARRLHRGRAVGDPGSGDRARRRRSRGRLERRGVHGRGDGRCHHPGPRVPSAAHRGRWRCGPPRGARGASSICVASLISSIPRPVDATGSTGTAGALGTWVAVPATDRVDRAADAVLAEPAPEPVRAASVTAATKVSSLGVHVAARSAPERGRWRGTVSGGGRTAATDPRPARRRRGSRAGDEAAVRGVRRGHRHDRRRDHADVR